VTGTQTGESRIYGAVGGVNVIVNGSMTINGSTATTNTGLGRSVIGCAGGPLVVSSGSDIIMASGASQGDAIIRDPYNNASSPITVNTQNLLMSAGAGSQNALNVALCSIGGGLTQSSNSNTGDITVNATGTVSLVGPLGGANALGCVIIGHMGGASATLGGAI